MIPHPKKTQYEFLAVNMYLCFVLKHIRYLITHYLLSVLVGRGQRIIPQRVNSHFKYKSI